MKYAIAFCFLIFAKCAWSKVQTIVGSLSQLANQEIRLEGFRGLKSYPIANAKIDASGNFKLNYDTVDYGVGYLISNDGKPMFVILSGENIEIKGETLAKIETVKVIMGQENLLFEQYAKEHPKREQALNAWLYLDKMYHSDPLFTVHKKSVESIEAEKLRIKTEESTFLANLPKTSYVNWFLPTRKLVSSVSTVAQYRPDEIQATLSAFRYLDYTDNRLYKSGLFKDAIDNHFWLCENSGKSLDSVFIEMKKSIDAMMTHLVKDQEKLNEITNYLFDLLERHSLFQASEYLALKVLNETSCTIDSELTKQLESYRAMKKGTIAPEIDFGNYSYVNGIKQGMFPNLSSFKTPYALVIFGASWCPKCMEEMPKIVQNYTKWRNLGVEVVFVSLDSEQTDFQKLIASYPFFTYCDFKKWESTPVKDYYVFGTPTMYLLDSNRQILLRPNSAEQMIEWVDWYLMERNK